VLIFDRENGQVVLKGFINVLVPLLVLVVGGLFGAGSIPGFVKVSTSCSFQPCNRDASVDGASSL
jgi:hypothetical protein